ncbi:hypothetical protein EDWATA_03057 [Edwardsiella tarda ATCC 23685]|uniref:Uncharacterized protein n=1 Tax=Edwardsiella tarda ATCC 23685 TaxID=500638 RepID=D4F8G4_EDWTA|nr:hypothetical protein EDWATA_03057 [Edwardsiella tarda ATCC 23685]
MIRPRKSKNRRDAGALLGIGRKSSENKLYPTIIPHSSIFLLINLSFTPVCIVFLSA